MKLSYINVNSSCHRLLHYLHTDVMCILRKLLCFTHFICTCHLLKIHDFCVVMLVRQGLTRWSRQILNSWHSCLSLPNGITGARDNSELTMKSAAWIHFNIFSLVKECGLFSIKNTNSSLSCSEITDSCPDSCSPISLLKELRLKH